MSFITFSILSELVQQPGVKVEKYRAVEFAWKQSVILFNY